MTPRRFINLFKSKVGRLMILAILLAGASYVVARRIDRSHETGLPVSEPKPGSEEQVVQTVDRPFSLFRPPPPDRPSTPVPAKPPITPKSEPKTEAAQAPALPIPAIGLFTEEPSAELAPERSPDAPFGRLIPCETVITVDSSRIQTPIIGLVTEDIFHSGRLLIPAGTEVHGTAQTDRARERIAGGSGWTLVWQSGEQLRLQAVALDREFENSTNHVGWGITDGSAGLRGRLIKSDDQAEVKLYAATLLSGVANALTEKQPTILGPIDSRSLNNAPLKGAEGVLEVYAERILESIERDGFYVRVPSGKQFYLYILQPIVLADRSPAIQP